MPIDRREELLRVQLEADPRFNLTARSEREFLEEQSSVLVGIINTIGVLIAVLMGAGAVFAALIVLGNFSMTLFAPLVFASVVAAMITSTSRSDDSNTPSPAIPRRRARRPIWSRDSSALAMSTRPRRAAS